ncbi:hypothetical protein AAG570_007150 [Ranatra chinensis]|uniref:Uncharacterized protein n=1 Tax=Ranatra chinensis TaxID=642074 RepID=A0ABD0XV41_9HEMI
MRRGNGEEERDQEREGERDNGRGGEALRQGGMMGAGPMGGPPLLPRPMPGKTKVLSILDRARVAMEESYNEYEEPGYYEPPAPGPGFGGDFNGGAGDYYDSGYSGLRWLEAPRGLASRGIEGLISGHICIPPPGDIFSGGGGVAPDLPSKPNLNPLYIKSLNNGPNPLSLPPKKLYFPPFFLLNGMGLDLGLRIQDSRLGTTSAGEATRDHICKGAFSQQHLHGNGIVTTARGLVRACACRIAGMEQRLQEKRPVTTSAREHSPSGICMERDRNDCKGLGSGLRLQDSRLVTTTVALLNKSRNACRTEAFTISGLETARENTNASPVWIASNNRYAGSIPVSRERRKRPYFPYAPSQIEKTLAPRHQRAVP